MKMNSTLKIGLLVLLIYGVICIALYFIQESLLFYPTKLDENYNYEFSVDFEEFNLKSSDGLVLNNLKFISKEGKGVVLFFHGNGGSINGWANGYSFYTNNGYDIIYTDYRGYGKSEGMIKNESQLINDAQVLYDFLKETYKESQIIVSGTSLGSGIACQIASKNNPQKLILNSPYASMKGLILEKMLIIPSLIIKYKLESIHHMEKVKCPITIFHGKNDDLIPYSHSLKLKRRYDEIDLIVLDGFGHNDIFESPEYVNKMREILK